MHIKYIEIESFFKIWANIFTGFAFGAASLKDFIASGLDVIAIPI